MEIYGFLTNIVDICQKPDFFVKYRHTGQKTMQLRKTDLIKLGGMGQYFR